MRFIIACVPSLVLCYVILAWRFALEAWTCGCNPGFPLTFWETTYLWILIVALGLIAAWDSDK
jgi:hypothetical protein